MRAYHFSNYYLDSIQQGIQAAHGQMELFVKYNKDKKSKQKKDLYNWAQKHKTMICLSGGNNEDLLSIEKLVSSPKNNFAYASFREDKASLGGLLTNVVVIVPEKFYLAAEGLRSGALEFVGSRIRKIIPYDPNPTFCGSYGVDKNKDILELNDFEKEFLILLSDSRLA